MKKFIKYGKSRTISFVLALCLFITANGFFDTETLLAESDAGYAEAGMGGFSTGDITDPFYGELAESSTVDVSAFDVKLSEAYLSVDALEKECAIFKYVDKEMFGRAGHAVRCRDDEALNTYVFLNRDGTKTVYLFDENVKYIGGDGRIYDKDITVKYSGEAEAAVGRTEANDVKLSLSKDPQSGVSLEYKEYRVSLKPRTDVQSGYSKAAGPSTVATSESVMYNDLFGEGIHLRYTPTLSGVKEDIVLSERTDKNEFEFILRTGGAGLFEENGRYYIAADKSSEARLYLGKVICYDAMGKPCVGSMSATAVEERQEYIITLIADKGFLQDAETVYPVTIDPTITVSDNTNGASAIQDAPIFKNKPTAAFGAFLYNTIGQADTNYGVGRTVVKLAGLAANTTYKALSASQITSVKFYAKEATGTAANTVNLYRLTGVPSWTEATVTWNNAGAFSTAESWGASLGGGAWTAFDITTLVKGWKSGAYTASMAFIMVMSGTETAAYKQFDSSDHTTTANRPYVALTYNSGISLNYTSLELRTGNTKQLTAATSPSGQAITWSSSNPLVASVSSSGLITASKAGSVTITAKITGTNMSASCTVTIRQADGVYRIKNTGNTNLCMMATLPGFNDGANVYIAGVTSGDAYMLRQLWRVHYLGNDYYSIRPMHCLSMGLNVSGTNAELRNIGISDTLSGVGSSAKWKLEFVSLGIRISNAGTGALWLRAEGETPSALGNIYMGSSGLTAYELWNFEKTDDPPCYVKIYNSLTGVFFAGEKYMTIGETKTLNEMNLLPMAIDAENLGRTFTWSSGNTSVASVSSTGTITAVSPGTAAITATMGSSKASFTVVVGAVESGTYYIRNKQFGKYLQIDNNAAPNYSSGGAIMEIWPLDGGDYQKWTLTLQPDGYYKIISVKSGLALAVPSGAESAEDKELVQETYLAGSPRQLWKIYKTASGGYKIQAKSAESQSTELVVAVGGSLTDGANGTNVEQRKYINNGSYKDEWEFMEAYSLKYVHYYDSSLLGNTSVLSQIESATEFCNVVYSRYGLSFSSEAAPVRYADAITDKCTRGINVPCSSSCGSCNSGHHKNIHRISDQLYNSEREDNHVYVLWTDRDYGVYCTSDHNLEYMRNAHAVVVDNRPVIHITNIKGNDDEKIWQCMVHVLAHETAHTMGMYEAYEKIIGHDMPRDVRCVMEQYEEEVDSDWFYSGVQEGKVAPFCQTCNKEMEKLTSEFFYKGN